MKMDFNIYISADVLFTLFQKKNQKVFPLAVWLFWLMTFKEVSGKSYYNQ